MIMNFFQRTSVDDDKTFGLFCNECFVERRHVRKSFHYITTIVECAFKRQNVFGIQWPSPKIYRRLLKKSHFPLWKCRLLAKIQNGTIIGLRTWTLMSRKNVNTNWNVVFSDWHFSGKFTKFERVRIGTCRISWKCSDSSYNNDNKGLSIYYLWTTTGNDRYTINLIFNQIICIQI